MKKKIKKIHYPARIITTRGIKKKHNTRVLSSVVNSYFILITRNQMHSNSISIHNITVTSLTSKFFIRTHFVVKQLFIVTKQLDPFKNL